MYIWVILQYDLAMTTTLSDLFNIDLFRGMVRDGYVRAQTSPDDPYMIYNYTEKAQYERVWNDVTLNCRGLIVNTETDEIVARGFPKFFNWDDSGQPYPPTGPMTLSTKFDGSLGILYPTSDYDVAIATRGSFTSDQAIHANIRLAEYLRGEYFLGRQIDELHDAGYTALFEIIYPSNRIVVNYYNDDRLVLLDVIENATGKSDLTRFDDFNWPDKAEKRLIAGGFNDSLTHEIPQGEEGFVLYWPGSGFRCKMKSAEYVELHRLVTGLSKKSVWEMYGAGKTSGQIKADVPDELFYFVDETIDELLAQATDILDQVEDDFTQVYTLELAGEFFSEGSMNRAPEHERRSAFARLASKYPATRAYLFKMYDGAKREDLFPMVWKSLKPVGDTRAWGRGEDVA